MAKEVSKVKRSQKPWQNQPVDEVIEERYWSVITTKGRNYKTESELQVVPNPAFQKVSAMRQLVRRMFITVLHSNLQTVRLGRCREIQHYHNSAVDEICWSRVLKATYSVVTTENDWNSEIIYHGTITLSNPDLPKEQNGSRLLVLMVKRLLSTQLRQMVLKQAEVVRDEPDYRKRNHSSSWRKSGTKESGSSQIKCKSRSKIHQTKLKILRTRSKEGFNW